MKGPKSCKKKSIQGKGSKNVTFSPPLATIEWEYTFHHESQYLSFNEPCDVITFNANFYVHRFLHIYHKKKLKNLKT